MFGFTVYVQIHIYPPCEHDNSTSAVHALNVQSSFSLCEADQLSKV